MSISPPRFSGMLARQVQPGFLFSDPSHQTLTHVTRVDHRREAPEPGYTSQNADCSFPAQAGQMLVRFRLDCYERQGDSDQFEKTNTAVVLHPADQTLNQPRFYFRVHLPLNGDPPSFYPATAEPPSVGQKRRREPDPPVSSGDSANPKWHRLA